MAIFENAVKNNPPEGECISGITEDEEDDDDDADDDDDVNFDLRAEAIESAM